MKFEEALVQLRAGNRIQVRNSPCYTVVREECGSLIDSRGQVPEWLGLFVGKEWEVLPSEVEAKMMEIYAVFAPAAGWVPDIDTYSQSFQDGFRALAEHLVNRK